MLRFIFTLFSAILLVIGTSAKAENDNPFNITFYGSFLHTETVPNALFFFNEIKQYDSFQLRRALRNHEIDTVVLASPGGIVWEGLNMAGIIHDKGIKTYIPELEDDFGCYSACSYMFFGGQIRRADGLLAVHQMSSRTDQAAKINKIEDDTQYTVSEIIGFLNEFETPPWVYEKMFRSTEFYIFDKDESNRLAARSDEIASDNIYEINAFISSYLKYLAESVVNKSDDNTAAKPATDKDEAEDLRQMVVEIQKLLNAAGCNAGVVDGIWGRKTKAAAVLFAKTAKLPTSNDDLVSAQFVKRLRAAPTNFCPKPIKKRKKDVIAALNGWWEVTSTCSSNKAKNPRSFEISYLRSANGSSTYTTKPYIAKVTHNYAGNGDVVFFGSVKYVRTQRNSGNIYRKYFSNCYAQLRKTR